MLTGWTLSADGTPPTILRLLSNPLGEEHQTIALEKQEETTNQSGFEPPSQEMETLRRFVSGDIDAFEWIFRRYQGDIYRWIVRVVRDPAAAEDLTVETLWRAYCRRYRFDVRRPFGPWVRRIALRTAIDHLRRKRDHRLLSPPAAQRPSHDPVEQTELRGAIREAFGRLPVRLRVAAILALIEGLPRQEIADVLGISLSAVKMRVARGLRILRKYLERKGFRP